MAGGFAITTTTTNAKLPNNRQGQFQFTVSNTSGRLLTVRGKAVAQTPEQSAWFTIEGQAERSIAPNATLNYTVNVAIPLTAPATPISFHMDAIGVENPDEYNVQGPAIVLEVPPAQQPKAPFPWWIVAVAAAALLLLGGGAAVVYHFVSGPGKTVASPTPTPTPTPDPIARFVGHWVDAQNGSTTLDIARNGQTLTGTFTGSCVTNVRCSFSGGNGTLAGPDTVTFQGSLSILGTATPFTVQAKLNGSNVMTLMVSSRFGTFGPVTMTKLA